MEGLWTDPFQRRPRPAQGSPGWSWAVLGWFWTGDRHVLVAAFEGGDTRRWGEAIMRTTTTDAGQGSRRRRLLVVSASALIVVALAAVLVVRSGPDGAAVTIDADGVPTVVHESVEALQAGDHDAWRRVRSADATLSDGRPVVADSPLGRYIARHGELDLEVSVLGCQEASGSASDRRVFECRVEGSEAIMRAAGVQGEATWTYVIDGGLIIESSPPFFDNGAEIAQAHAALASYLRDVDRATFEELCNVGALDFFHAGLGPDCTAFIGEHLAGFAASTATGTS